MCSSVPDKYVIFQYGDIFLLLKVNNNVTSQYSCSIEWYINIHIALFKNADITFAGLDEQTYLIL